MPKMMPGMRQGPDKHREKKKSMGGKIQPLFKKLGGLKSDRRLLLSIPTTSSDS